MLVKSGAVDVQSPYITWREKSSNINDLCHGLNQGLLPLHYLHFYTQIKPAGILPLFILNIFYFSMMCNRTNQISSQVSLLLITDPNNRPGHWFAL